MTFGLPALYPCFADTRYIGTPLITAAVPLAFADVRSVLAGVGDAGLLGLNKRGNLNLCGVGEGAGVGVALGVGSVIAFLRLRFGFGEAAGDSAADGDAAFSAGDALASTFLDTECFRDAGDSLEGVPVSSCDRTSGTHMVRLIANTAANSLPNITASQGYRRVLIEGFR
ncbi:MAG TPA: hypothetical protein VFQ78_12170 [Candidatus Udaeobacter sp.]|nr:hypothetical protein [Candidatus Udaeobacter sp.]